MLLSTYTKTHLSDGILLHYLLRTHNKHEKWLGACQNLLPVQATTASFSAARTTMRQTSQQSISLSPPLTSTTRAPNFMTSRLRIRHRTACERFNKGKVITRTVHDSDSFIRYNIISDISDDCPTHHPQPSLSTSHNINDNDQP